MQRSLFQRVDLEEDVSLDPNITYIKDYDSGLLKTNDRLHNAKEFAFDLETYGDDEFDGLRWWQGKIRLMQFGFRDGATFIVDWLLLEAEYKSFILKRLKPALENPNIVKITQNGKFDCCFCIGQLGIHPRGIRDTMLLSQLYWAGVKQYRHNLAAVVKRELDIELDKTEQANYWGEEKLLNKQLNYAAKDVQILFPLYDALRAKINKYWMHVQAKIECEALPVLAEMECNGFPVDEELVKESLQQHLDLANQQIAIFKGCFPTIPITASAKTLVPLLNDKLGIKLGTTDDGELSNYKHLPVIKAIANYRSLKKQIDYLKGILVNVRGGRCYTNYRQLNNAGFGRTGCGKINKKLTAKDGINLQNVPNPFNKELLSIRSCFKPVKGRSLIVCDLASAHARIAAQVSQDEALLDIYNKGQDMHLVTAIGLSKQSGYDWDYEYMEAGYNNQSHADYSEIAKLRKTAKPVFYGSLNKQGAKTLQTTALKWGVEMTESESRLAIDSWRDTYFGVYVCQERLTQEANAVSERIPGIDGEFGYTCSISHRQLWMQKIPDQYNGGYSVKASDCVAFQWTATESDIMKLAKGLVQRDFDQHSKWEAKLVNINHDELDAECNSHYELEVATSVFNRMNEAMRRWIKSIPVNEPNAKPQDCIVESWGCK